MTEHVAAEPHVEHVDHGHHAHDNSPDAIRKEMKKYLTVFAALAGLTVITVAIAQMHLPTWQAVSLALVVASIKAGLVAAVFMHLLSERRLIYAVLLITMFFFGVLLWGPWHHRYDAMGQSNTSAPAPEQSTGQSQGH
jgi:cytochrome c oxidase subunit IV